MRCSLVRSLLLALLLVSISRNFVFAQGSARIAGAVTDPTGGAISSAEVTLTHAATGQTHTMTTSVTGSYTFLDLVPGVYNISAKAPGFKTYSQSGISVQVGHAITLNIPMEIGAVTESLTVVS